MLVQRLCDAVQGPGLSSCSASLSSGCHTPSGNGKKKVEGKGQRETLPGPSVTSYWPHPTHDHCYLRGILEYPVFEIFSL